MIPYKPQEVRYRQDQHDVLLLFERFYLTPLANAGAGPRFLARRSFYG